MSGQTIKTKRGRELLAPQPLELIGAEGQNRTADTGIFSSQTYDNQVTKSNPQ